MGSREIEALAELLNQCFRLLRDTRVKFRKEGATKLGEILEHEYNLIVIDTLTFGLPPKDSELSHLCQEISWASILSNLGLAIDKDVQVAIERGRIPDAALSTRMREILNKATSYRKTAHIDVLEPCSNLLFAHISGIMSVTAKIRDCQVYHDYAHMLKLLLGNESYRRCMSYVSWVRLLRSILRVLKEGVETMATVSGKASQALVTNFQLLKYLIRYMPYDIPDPNHTDILWLFHACADIEQQQIPGRVVAEVLSTFANYILYCQGDYLEKLREVMDSLHNLAMVQLRKGEKTTKEAARQVYKAALKFDICLPQHIDDLRRWHTQTDLKGIFEGTDKHPLSIGQSSLSSLIAILESRGRDVTVHRANDHETRLSQRMRYSSFMIDAFDCPSSYGPIICSMLLYPEDTIIVSDVIRFVNYINENLQRRLEQLLSLEDASADIVWIIRIIFSLAILATRRSDIQASCEDTLLNITNLLVKHFNPLMRTSMGRDAMFMLLSLQLTKMAHILTKTFSLSLTDDILIGSPTESALEAMLALRRCSESSEIGDEIFVKSVEWVTSFQLQELSIGLKTALLTDLLRIRDTYQCQYLSSVYQEVPPWAWWAEDEFDTLLRSKFGDMRSPLLNINPAANVQFATELRPNINHHKIVSRAIESMLGRGISLAQYSSVTEALRPTAFALLLLLKLTRAHSQPLLPCWGCESGFFRELKASIEICSNMIIDGVENALEMDNDAVLLVESIMKVLAELQRHAPSHPMLSSLIGAMHIPDKVKAMNSISIDRLFSERNENFEGLQLRPMLPSQRTNTVDFSKHVDVPFQKRMRWPMFHWYLHLLNNFASLSPKDTHVFVKEWKLHMRTMNFFIPICLRNNMIRAQLVSFFSLIEKDFEEWFVEVNEIDFLDSSQGIFSYDNDYRRYSGIYENIVQISLQLLRECRCLSGEKAEACLGYFFPKLLEFIKLPTRTNQNGTTSRSDTLLKSPYQRIVTGRAIEEMISHHASLFPNPDLESMVEYSMSLLCDDRFAVRSASSIGFIKILKKFSSPMELFCNSVERLPLVEDEDNETSMAFFKTNVQYLGCVAIHVPEIELLAVALLVNELDEKQMRKEQNEIIKQSILHLSNELGYSLGEYIQQILPDLVHRLESLLHYDSDLLLKRALFAVEFLGNDYKKRKHNTIESLMVAKFVMDQDDAGLCCLKDLSSTPLNKLVSDGLPSIVAAQILNNKFLNASVALNSIQNRLDWVCETFGITAFPWKQKVVVEGLFLCISGSSFEKMAGTTSDIDGSMVQTEGEESINAVNITTIIEEMVKSASWSSSEVMRIFNNIHATLGRFQHERHKILVIPALRSAVEYFGCHLCVPAIGRYVLSILCRLVRLPMIADSAGDLVLKALKLMSAQDSSNSCYLQLGNMIPIMVTSLVDAYYVCGSDEAGSSTAHRCLEFLLKNLPACLRGMLSLVDPIPPNFMISEVRELIEVSLNELSPEEHLENFADRIHSLNEDNKISLYITFLRKRLFPDGSVDCISAQGARSRRLQNAIWKIVTHSHSSGNQQLISFACELVSHMGPFEPELLSFNPTELVKKNFEVTACMGEKNVFTKMKIGVYSKLLHLLAGYLIEDDANLVQASVQVLEYLLSTSEGIQALQQMDSSTAVGLDTFKGKYISSSCEQFRGLIESDLSTVRNWDLKVVTYEDWIKSLGEAVLKMSDDQVLYQSANLACMRASFSETILPLAFAYLALFGDISNEISAKITEHILPNCNMCPKAMKSLLQWLHALRSIHGEQMHSAESEKANYQTNDPRKWKKVYWFDLCYLQVCEACISCRSFFSALIFAETWKKGNYDCSHPRDDMRYDRLMLEIYSNIPEPDGLYSVTKSIDLLSQLKRFEREGDWTNALLLCDTSLQVQSEYQNYSMYATNIQKGEALLTARRCLANMGMMELLGKTEPHSCHYAVSTSTDVSELGKWVPLDIVMQDGKNNGLLLNCMESLKAGNPEQFQFNLRSIQEECLRSLSSAGMESTGDLNPLIIKLQMAQEFSEAWDLKWGRNNTINPQEKGKISDQERIRKCLHLWVRREKCASSGWRFDLEMPLKDLKLELLSTLKSHELKAESLVDMAYSARKAGRYGQATAALAHLRHILATSNGTGEKWVQRYLLPDAQYKLEEVKVLWAQKQFDAAVLTLNAMALEAGKQLKELPSQTNTASQLTRLEYLNVLRAKWNSITARESSEDIVELISTACDSLQERGSDPRISCRAYYRLGTYTEKLALELKTKMQSSEFEMSKSVVKDKKKQVKIMEEKLQSIRRSVTSENQIRSVQIAINKLKNAIQEDQDELNEIETRLTDYHALSILGYCSALMQGDQYDLPALFHMIKIWFEISTNPVAMGKELVLNCPSHKFLPLSYQLASRIVDIDNVESEESDSFVGILFRLIETMGAEHPHHILPVLFALMNGDKNREGKPSSVSGRAWSIDVNMSRIRAARKMINAISHAKMNGRRNRQQIVSEMQEATDGYISLAAMAVEKEQTVMSFPASFRRKLMRLHQIPILSIDIPVDPKCSYDDIPYITFVEETITFPGGINKPKLVTLTDSTGTVRKQLVKGGNDDLRQDAVMQQFFSVLNGFLEDEKDTASRRLSIKTYKALPFSPAAGLLEWVDNTMDLKSFIINDNLRYQREVSKALSTMYHQQKGREGQIQHGVHLKNLVKAFNKCLQMVPPMLSQVFLLRFPDPGRWFEARLAYTRSVAVNSMAGHIIGLGDRHSSNILVDIITAEVVHIDLGIAFEQGKLLITPERVPFRLTQNIIDGMGVQGVEGVMRRCCEETLRMLRKQKDPLLTVLSVFIHDPLYKWALTFNVAQKRQVHDGFALEEEQNRKIGNADATRTLLRIQRKLEGFEADATNSRGVEGQVQYLLNEATNPVNLARMYYGWQAYL